MSNGRPRIHPIETLLSGSDYQFDNVPLLDILFDSEFNCRGEFTYESVAQLAETIKAAGLLYPVILWPRTDLPNGKKFMLVAGHRRYRAYELLKEPRIPAIIRPDLDQRKAEIINFIENLQRKDLNIVQESVALKKRYPQGGSLREIAKEIGKDAMWVQKRLRVIELPLDIQNLLATEQIPGRYVDQLYEQFKAKGPAAAIEDANLLLAARKGRGVESRKLPSHLRKSKFHKPTQIEVVQMITTLLDSRIGGLTAKYAAWREGWISSEEFIAEMKRRVPKWAFRAAEESDLPE